MARTNTKKSIETALTPDMHLAVVNAGRAGYRRAGVGHAKGRVVHPPGTFTEAQIAQLQDDPKIVIVKSDPPAAEEAES